MKPNDQEKQVFPLRVHHLLCTQLFQGYGYNNQFCLNMKNCIHLLYKEDPNVILVCEPDIICNHCPNLTKNNHCSSDESVSLTDVRNVSAKDNYLANALSLNLEKPTSFSTLYRLVNERMTQEVFLHSCQSCRWFKEGLCSYEAFIGAYQNL